MGGTSTAGATPATRTRVPSLAQRAGTSVRCRQNALGRVGEPAAGPVWAQKGDGAMVSFRQGRALCCRRRAIFSTRPGGPTRLAAAPSPRPRWGPCTPPSTRPPPPAVSSLAPPSRNRSSSAAERGRRGTQGGCACFCLRACSALTRGRARRATSDPQSRPRWPAPPPVRSHYHCRACPLAAHSALPLLRAGRLRAAVARTHVWSRSRRGPTDAPP